MQEEDEVKILIFADEEDLLVRASEILTRALGPKISISRPRLSQDGEDYRLVAYLKIDEEAVKG